MATGVYVNLPNETYHLRIHLLEGYDSVWVGEIGDEKRYIEAPLDIPEWELVGLLADAYLDEQE